jgi:ornithine cyclodeaminase/alanine dehydrogenase-like protein (mu-crystallin family)
MNTLLLSAADVKALLTADLCIAAVEDAFRQLAEGKIPRPGVLGMHHGDGSFHAKAAFLTVDRPYFAAKLNANFPHNGARHGLPTIQGVVMLCDATNGATLAVMDSMAITALRTAAATAVAARHLAPESCDAALLCGCGAQAAAQLHALLSVRRPQRLYVFDQDRDKARVFAAAFATEVPVNIAAVAQLPEAIDASRIVITCTTSRRYFVGRDMVRPGTFIAAVGADSESKQELDPALLAAATVVTDLTEQAASIGDLHHAIAAGLMSRADVHAELGEIVAGRKPGRMRADEITVFDSTGTGLQDVAAAVAVHQRALAKGEGRRFAFNP